MQHTAEGSFSSKSKLNSCRQLRHFRYVFGTKWLTYKSKEQNATCDQNPHKLPSLKVCHVKGCHSGSRQAADRQHISFAGSEATDHQTSTPPIRIEDVSKNRHLKKTVKTVEHIVFSCKI